ncbi:MAG: ParB/RepB/Spo0J family partition protein [Planctomycetota bacterium]|nr:ParB/RepB/Spo0J family partition protein [Planctomycetota bacterium]
MAKNAKSAHPKPRLGRGLSSLIPHSAPSPDDDKEYQHVTGLPPASTPTAVPISGREGEPLEIGIDQICPNPYQPRREFDAEELAELADSIRQQGILQPLIVAPAGDAAADKPYVLIAGERRLRAAGEADLSTVPCIVRQASGQQMLEWALVENIQRADLNCVERAEAYRQYIDRFGLTQQQAAERLGQPRATVANYLRILDLHQDIQRLLAAGELTFGHAKVLAGLQAAPGRQLALARKAARRSLSVRQLEALVSAEPSHHKPAQRHGTTKPAYLLDVEEQLTRAVGTRVTIRPGRAKHTGRVEIEYYNLDEFDRIATALGAKLES